MKKSFITSGPGLEVIFFMLYSPEHEISTKIKAKMLKNNRVCILLINVKTPTIGILTFKSITDFV